MKQRGKSCIGAILPLVEHDHF